MSWQSSVHTVPSSLQVPSKGRKKNNGCTVKITLSPEGGSGQRQRGARQLADNRKLVWTWEGVHEDEINFEKSTEAFKI